MYVYMHIYIYIYISGCPQWTTVMKPSLKVLMDAKQHSFTKDGKLVGYF